MTTFLMMPSRGDLLSNCNMTIFCFPQIWLRVPSGTRFKTLLHIRSWWWWIIVRYHPPHPPPPLHIIINNDHDLFLHHCGVISFLMSNLLTCQIRHLEIGGEKKKSKERLHLLAGFEGAQMISLPLAPSLLCADRESFCPPRGRV